jgi:hypothetical protein
MGSYQGHSVPLLHFRLRGNGNLVYDHLETSSIFQVEPQSNSRMTHIMGTNLER